jgi:hypothetical protein
MAPEPAVESGEQMVGLIGHSIDCVWPPEMIQSLEEDFVQLPIVSVFPPAELIWNCVVDSRNVACPKCDAVVGAE